MCCRPAMLRDSLRFPPLLVATAPSLVASVAAAVGASACCHCLVCELSFLGCNSFPYLDHCGDLVCGDRQQSFSSSAVHSCAAAVPASSCASCSLQPASSSLPAPRGALNYYNLPVPRVVSLSLLAHGLVASPACVAAVQPASSQLLIEFQIAQFLGADLWPSPVLLQRLKSEIMLFQR